ncbi:MAG TPA: hypothetical protein HPP87_04470 [Planctomycetes bacterium]|nr:hypothetical protein [Planctomycetota bacterium]
METIDYYCPTTVTSTVGYTMGRAVGAVRSVTIQAVDPVKAGAVVALGWGGIAALINAKKYRQGRMTKRDAVLDTGGEAVGLGVASGLGLLASNAARLSTMFATTSALVPFAIGVVVTASSKVVWDCNVKRHLKCEATPVA